MVKCKQIKYSKSKQEAYLKLNSLLVDYIVDTRSSTSSQSGSALQKGQYLDFYLEYDKGNKTIKVDIMNSNTPIGILVVQDGVWSYCPASRFGSLTYYRLEQLFIKKLKGVIGSLLNYTMWGKAVVLTVVITRYGIFYSKRDSYGDFLEIGKSPNIDLG